MWKKSLKNGCIRNDAAIPSGVNVAKLKRDCFTIIIYDIILTIANHISVVGL